MSKWNQDAVGAEALEWVNNFLAMLWPEMDKVAQHIIESKITPRMQEKAAQKASQLKDMRFSHFTLGKATPKVTGLHVSTTPYGGSKVRMMIDYQSDMAVELLAMKMKVGMKSFHLSGEVVVLMRPVMEDYPGNVGGMTMYFVNRPWIDLDFTGLANVADFGGVKGIVRQVISDIFAEKLVIPNAITTVIGFDDLVVYPPVLGPPHPPVGALTVKVLKAEGIRDGDFHIPFASKVEDNYVKFAIGDRIWKAPIGNLPQEHTFVVLDPMQKLSISVWDEDTLTADDFLGTVGEFTISEAQALNGKELQVRDPSRKEGHGGILQMEVSYSHIVPYKLSPGENIVVVQFQEVFLHFDPEGKFCVRARVGQEQRTTRPTSPMVQKVKTNAAKSVVEDMETRLRKEGVQEDIIKRVTAMEGLRVLSEPSRVPLNVNLSFPVAPEELHTLSMDIEVVQIAQVSTKQKKENVLGSYKYALEACAKDPTKEDPRMLEIESEAGRIQVKASMFVCALEPGEAPVGGKLLQRGEEAVEARGTSAAAVASEEQDAPQGGSPKTSKRSGKWFHLPFSKSNSGANSP